jgi:hypothetical protein
LKVVAHAHAPIEALGTVQAEMPVSADWLATQETQMPLGVEPTLEFRLLSAQGIIFGGVVLVIGLLVWRFKHVRAIGDNMVTAGLLVLLANLLQWLHKRMARSKVELFHRLSQKLSKYE